MWTPNEKVFLGRLNTPKKIQDYLDSIDYDVKGVSCSARGVIRCKKADCFSGALFGAAALERIGFPPLIVELCAVNDDGHMLAVFKAGGWGAVAKSNFTTLRYREPVYATLRELVMSYFDFYFNLNGEKTLRSFSEPLDLRKFGNEWMISDVTKIEDAIDSMPHQKILTPEKERALAKADNLLLKAGLLGSKPEGLFKPRKRIRKSV